jgi:hypothetical protein
MKNVIARTALLILPACLLLGASGCQTQTNLPVQSPPGPSVSSPNNSTQTRLNDVLLAKARAGLGNARILIDDGQIVSVWLHGSPYLKALKKINTSDCPENFRLAWSDYLAAWERKLNHEKATPDTVDAISMWKGNFADLPATVRCLEPYDTNDAWQNCERIAQAYGVDAAKINVP